MATTSAPITNDFGSPAMDQLVAFLESRQNPAQTSNDADLDGLDLSGERPLRSVREKRSGILSKTARVLTSDKVLSAGIGFGASTAVKLAVGSLGTYAGASVIVSALALAGAGAVTTGTVKFLIDHKNERNKLGYNAWSNYKKHLKSSTMFSLGGFAGFQALDFISSFIPDETKNAALGWALEKAAPVLNHPWVSAVASPVKTGLVKFNQAVGSALGWGGEKILNGVFSVGATLFAPAAAQTAPSAPAQPGFLRSLFTPSPDGTGFLNKVKALASSVFSSDAAPRFTPEVPAIGTVPSSLTDLKFSPTEFSVATGELPNPEDAVQVAAPQEHAPAAAEGPLAAHFVPQATPGAVTTLVSSDTPIDTSQRFVPQNSASAQQVAGATAPQQSAPTPEAPEQVRAPQQQASAEQPGAQAKPAPQDIAPKTPPVAATTSAEIKQHLTDVLGNKELPKSTRIALAGLEGQNGQSLKEIALKSLNGTGGLPKNVDLAVAAYEAAIAKDGNIQAVRDLAVLKFHGLQGVAQDKAAAMALLQEHGQGNRKAAAILKQFAALGGAEEHIAQAPSTPPAAQAPQPPVPAERVAAAPEPAAKPPVVTDRIVAAAPQQAAAAPTPAPAPATPEQPVAPKAAASGPLLPEPQDTIGAPAQLAELIPAPDGKTLSARHAIVAKGGSLTSGGIAPAAPTPPPAPVAATNPAQSFRSVADLPKKGIPIEQTACPRKIGSCDIVTVTNPNTCDTGIKICDAEPSRVASRVQPNGYMPFGGDGSVPRGKSIARGLQP